MAAPGEDSPSSAAQDAAPEVALPESAPPATTGAILAAARNAAGLDLDDIARSTRVPLRHLKALEADSHESLPALPYAQGFVRAFASSVGLDPEELSKRFRAETSKQPHVPSNVPMAALDERRLPSPGLVIVSLVALVVVISLLSAWGAGAFDPDTPPAPPVVMTPPVERPVATLAPPPPPPSLAQGPVVLTASEEVWVRIFDPATQTIAFSGIMQPGQKFEVPASPPGLRLWTGRAGALVITLSGRALPPLGGPAEVLKDVSLAPADLIARPAPSPVSAPVSAPVSSPVLAPVLAPVPAAGPSE